MKLGIIIIVALLLSAVAASVLLTDPGYVAVSIRGYLFETSVPVLLFAIVSIFIAIWFVQKMFSGMRKIGEARGARAGKKLTQGLIEVAEGNYAKGEKLLARATTVSETPLFGYLQAARAAHLQGEDGRRDEWLKIAYEKKPDAANAVLLTQAEFQLDRGQYEQALATLRQLEDDSRNHGYALALLGRLYFQLGDWKELDAVLPRIRKHSNIKQETLDAWSTAVHRDALETAQDSRDVDTAWKGVAKPLKTRLELLEAYFEALARVGESDRAEKELASRLKSDWRAPLISLYGRIESSDPSRQLATAERWLDKHADDTDLLLTTARLCLRNELWGKARSYLETVLTLKPSPEAYQEYGHLLNQMGEGDAAAQAFRDGLGMVSGAPVPQIPHLDADQG